MDQSPLQGLLDRLAIMEVVNSIAVDTDLRDWAAVRACFADDVAVDYTSLNGGSPATMPASDLIAGWQATLDGFQATHHKLTNHRISILSDTATCLVYVHATHYLPNPFGGALWTVGGHYSYDLIRTAQGWKVRSMTFTATWGDGNQRLVELARERAAQADQHHK